MTKTEKVAALSTAKSEPAVRKVQTERAIQDLIKELAESLAKLSDESRTTARGLLRRMTQSANAADQSIQDSTKAAAESAEALVTALDDLLKANDQAKAHSRWTLLTGVSLIAFSVGLLSLVTLLILQPRLLLILWNVSKALGLTQ